MSSLTKRISKGLLSPSLRAAAIKRRGDRSNITRNVSSAGYEVCHFTKGWRRISAKRLGAQHRLAVLSDR